MSEETTAIEARMLQELKDHVANNRDALDCINSFVWQRVSMILGYGPLLTDGWFLSPCSILGGERPIDVLEFDESKVFMAAQYKKQDKWVG